MKKKNKYKVQNKKTKYKNIKYRIQDTKLPSETIVAQTTLATNRGTQQ